MSSMYYQSCKMTFYTKTIPNFWYFSMLLEVNTILKRKILVKWYSLLMNIHSFESIREVRHSFFFIHFLKIGMKIALFIYSLVEVAFSVIFEVNTVFLKKLFIPIDNTPTLSEHFFLKVFISFNHPFPIFRIFFYQIR
jgi:hypothetical protein